MSESHATHDNPAAHVDKPATLFLLTAIIAAGSFATVFASMAGLEGKAIFVHMAISIAQASIVLYFFMHLKRSDSLTWLCVGSAFFFSGIQFAMTLGDFLTRQWGGL